uniref:Immunoglobulin domain-containing protein n=1 Tax=Pygocentrus nattereri TaxID=42514 RepID=A0A3B4CXG6_PYGNA
KMSVVLYIVCLFVWFQPAHSSTDMLVDLGQNVSLNCDLLAVKEIYWFLQQYPSPPKPILRSFYRNSSPYFYNHSFKVKYSLQEKLQLAIQNITKNELGIFYCVETGDLMFRKGIRLYIMGKLTFTCISIYTHYIKPFLYNDNMKVYDIVRGKLSKNQDASYRNRTESFPDEYSKGIFSIKLSKVRASDKGMYSCFISFAGITLRMQYLSESFWAVSFCPFIMKFIDNGMEWKAIQCSLQFDLLLYQTSFCSKPFLHPFLFFLSSAVQAVVSTCVTFL